MAYQTGEDTALRRVIGRLGFGTMNINGVIGAGIFGLPARICGIRGVRVKRQSYYSGA